MKNEWWLFTLIHRGVITSQCNSSCLLRILCKILRLSIGLWSFRFAAVSVCGRSGLWPFRFVTVSVCGLSGLWPFRSVAVPVCGLFGLWPFRFVAVSVVAVLVCGHYDLLPTHLYDLLAPLVWFVPLSQLRITSGIRQVMMSGDPLLHCVTMVISSFNLR